MQILVVQLELREQEGHQIRRAIDRDLETHRLAQMPSPPFVLHGLQHVIALVVAQARLAVTRHPERRAVLDRHAWK